MGVIRNTASMQIRGKVGNTTYYVEGGRQIARVSQNGSNYGESASRSEAQQFQRGKWGNLVNFYKVSKAWMPKAFESKKRTQSDYNRFMQLNTPNARIYLTKNMYANGGCVADAFRISEGSLRPIGVVQSGNRYRTDLSLGDYTISAATSVGAFSLALLENNNHLRRNMQISFISYQQTLSPDNVPGLICTAYEVTLDTESSEVLANYLPNFCGVSVDGYLGTSDQISTGAFAYVLSETINGKTSVSTQSLIAKNTSLIAEFSSAAAIAASIASYGVDKDVFLTSGSYPVGATPQPILLTNITYNARSGEEVSILPGSLEFDLGNLFAGTSGRVLHVQGRYTNLVSVTFITSKGNRAVVTSEKLSDGDIALNSISSAYYSESASSLEVVLDGTTYKMDFIHEIE